MTVLQRVSEHIQRAPKRPDAVYLTAEDCAQLFRDVEALQRVPTGVAAFSEMSVMDVPVRPMMVLVP